MDHPYVKEIIGKLAQDTDKKKIYIDFLKKCTSINDSNIMFIVILVVVLYNGIGYIMYEGQNNVDCKSELKDILFSWLDDIQDKLETKSYMKLLDDLLIKYKNFLEKYRNIFYADSVDKISINCIDNTIKLLKLLQENNGDYICQDKDNKTEFIIEITKLHLIQKFFQCISDAYGDTLNFFSYRFCNKDNKELYLSSGEEEILDMYSKLFKSLEEITISTSKENAYEIIDKKLDSVIIFLDEPDTYLHPEWKRVFLCSFFEFIQKIFSGINVQLIITSNSAILAGDISREDIIKLKDSKIEEYCNDSEDTFAKNLLALFKDTFGMSSLIGEFSTQKIHKVIEKIQENKLDSNQIRDIQKTINIIGEPVIKRKVQELFDEKFNCGLTKEEMSIIKNANSRGYTLDQIFDITGISKAN